MFLLFVFIYIFAGIMRRYLTLFLFMCISAVMLHAQLNSNPGRLGYSSSGLDRDKYDRNGNPIDTTNVVDANTVPIGLFSWKIDSRLGNVKHIPVDTLQAGFQNSNDTGGYLGQYNYLGNLGSPRISRLFFQRNDPTQEFFTDPYDFSIMRPEKIEFINTLSPYTNLSYWKGGGGANAEERFRSYFSVNANKRFGIGFYIDYIYGRGLYASQSTALFNGGLFASYMGDKYNMHAVLNTDNLKMTENGGIADDRYITNPLDMAEGKKQYRSDDIATKYSKIWNHNTGYHGFLTHRYNIGFYREKQDTILKDSVRTIQTFVPVTSFIHTLQIDDNTRKYISYNDEQNQKYFEHNYLGSDSINNIKSLLIRNTLGISLLEGFNKWAKSGITAFISFENRKFTLQDTIPGETKRRNVSFKENNLSLGGVLSKTQGSVFHYNVTGEYTLTGKDAGQFSIEGKGDMNFRLFGDTIRLGVNGFVKNQNPVFYMRHFYSKHYWWNNDDLSKTFRTRIEGNLKSEKLGTDLRIGVENIKNYTYLANTSIVANDGTNNYFKNNATVMQNTDNIQVLSAVLNQKLHAGILHLDTEIAYQKSTNNDVLPLPDLSVYGNLYLKAALAKKVLNVEIGADVRYFTKYYAPDYSPVIGQFYTQNPDDKIEIGAYPIVNLYANLHLKRTRFFVMMYHINQGSGNSRYFLAPHYPVNPKMFKFGLSWNFFD